MTFDAVLAEVEGRIAMAKEQLEYEAKRINGNYAQASAVLMTLEALRKWMLEELDRSLCEQAKVKEGVEG
jgi:hypothetical protein